MPKQPIIPLSETVCRKRLTKWIGENYSESVQEYIGYYNDIILDGIYSFLYELPNGANKLLSIDRISGEIKESEVTEREAKRQQQLG